VFHVLAIRPRQNDLFNLRPVSSQNLQTKLTRDKRQCKNSSHLLFNPTHWGDTSPKSDLEHE
jgi:hypothetical protein